MSSIEKLLDVMSQLRHPETGCAWDLEQTFETIAPYTIEEAYEVADAIDRNSIEDLQDELGDLLFHVVFHSRMAEEQNAFNFDDVTNSIIDKLTRRHPHVFGDARNGSPEEIKAAWESLKAQERDQKNLNGPVSALADVTPALPALTRAAKIQKRAARVGFDWPNVEPVWDKLSEEIGEVREAVANEDSNAIEDEVGDLLFTVVNLARHLSVDSELALKRSTAKFEKRFRQVEQLAGSKNQELANMALPELDALWDKAKTQI